MAGSRLLAIAPLALGLACAGAPAPRCELRPAPDAWRYAGVEVAVAPGASQGPEADARIAAAVGQSTRDWLEQRGRLTADGNITVEVTVTSARVRSAAVAFLFAWAASPDHLAARVSLRRGDERVTRCPARVESALSGWSFRDPEPRRDRLARRLGHRIAEGL
jgi:hypothetical protein